MEKTGKIINFFLPQSGSGEKNGTTGSKGDVEGFGLMVVVKITDGGEKNVSY